MDPNFVRADNSNLPKIDAFMVAHFFKNNADYYAAELKNVKTAIYSAPEDDQPGIYDLATKTTMISFATLMCRGCEYALAFFDYTDGDDTPKRGVPFPNQGLP
ncbi:hypothetical protein EVAR_9502_1 [Eumeta japonica]|uniref:Uncharacterized protein n=1 Tax=Eumeta variegata TaxID=151549 RepID=A0A4C1U3G8_EUMVA|nr:hypothetical protein EVAR_9502_1 [Eumeta japonica]